ncbi:MAG: PilW family protein [bacterium]
MKRQNAQLPSSHTKPARAGALCRPHRDRLQRGFTLAEMMITMVLGTVVAIGAFHIHATFQYSLHRQDEITRIQGTMKVTRQLLERRIRPAGAGMTGTVSHWCGGQTQMGPFVFHNSNVIGQKDLTGGNADNDPDWFEIMAADMSRNGNLTSSHPVTSVVKDLTNPTYFQPGTLFGLKNANGVCILMVTDVKMNKDGTGTISYQQGGDPLWQCYNNAQWKQDCRNDVLKSNDLPAGSEILNFGAGTFGMRIDSSKPAVPVLMMASGVAGGNALLYDWQPLAMHVEDLQIALHLDTSVPADEMGDIWVNDRDLTDAELGRVRSVRVSIVFRSASEIPGWRAGRRPALEDRPAANTTDGYIRRVMTTVIKLRNRVEEAPVP